MILAILTSVIVNTTLVEISLNIIFAFVSKKINKIKIIEWEYLTNIKIRFKFILIYFK